MTEPKFIMFAIALILFIAIAIHFIFFTDFTMQCSVCGRRGKLVKYIYIDKDIKYYCAACFARKENTQNE